MNMKFCWPCTALVAAISAASGAQAATLPDDCAGLSLPSTIAVRAGFQEPLSLAAAVTRVGIGNPEVADVTVTSPRSLLLLGRKAGDTGLVVWTRCSAQPMQVTITVPAPPPPVPEPVPLTPAQRFLQAAVPDEKSVKDLPSQVQVDIRFIELSRSRLESLGVRFGGGGGPVTFGSAGVGLDSTSKTFSIPVDSNPFNILYGAAGKSFAAAINLLEQNGYAYTVSQPTLVALSGQSATFLAGGEVPIPVPQGITGTIAIQYKEYGVRLSVNPTVVSANQVILKVAPEVSELDYANALTLQSYSVPALRVRRTDTSISLADGESFVIGGLVSRTMRDNVSKLPGLADMPVLGAFFRSRNFQSGDSELLMVVTPHLVRPMAATASQPPLPGMAWRSYDPGAGELFWHGPRSPYSTGKER